MSKETIKKRVENISFKHQVVRDGIVYCEPDALIKIETKIYGDLYLKNNDDIETKEIGEATAYVYDFDRFDYDEGISPAMAVHGYGNDVKNNFERFLIDPETGSYNKRLLKTIKKKFDLDFIEDFDKQVITMFGRIILVYTRRTYPDYRGNGITPKYYHDLDETFRPDLIVTYPFPLQYERENTTKIPENDEFGLTFKAARKKLRSIYAKAGMMPLYDGWMAKLGLGFRSYLFKKS